MRIRSKKEKEAEDDKQSIDKQEAPPAVSIKTLFRYATKKELLAIVASLICAMGAAACFPIMMTMYKDIVNSLVYTGMDPGSIIQQLLDQLDTTIKEILSGEKKFTDEEKQLINETLQYAYGLYNMDFFPEARHFGVGCIIIGIAELILCYIYVTSLNISAEKQVFRIRNMFLKSVLRQDMGWYDTSQTGDFASRVAEDISKLQEGMGEKLGMFLMFFTIFWSCLINAFVNGWKLTLVILCILPALALGVGITAKVHASMTAIELQAYGKAGAVAEEVLGAVRTVYAFGGQRKEVDRYNKNLVYATAAGKKRGIISALGAGILWLTIFSGFGLAFWYGTKLIMESRLPECDPDNCGEYDPGIMLLVFISVMMGSMNVGMAVPHIETFEAGRSSAAVIYDVVDRKSPIDSLSEEGKRPDGISGNIKFKNVVFNYPARPDVPVLQGLTLTINPGETVALVGSSGCGKSTTVQLMQRFYDPLQGQVTLDGIDLKDLNIGWLRENIGIVSQEPVLFATTILENIKQGKPSATMEDVVEAAKAANAHDFVTKLPDGYNTLVGERGAQLSGGQKQRIAIARALVRDPRLLLLDEATSALDNHSEALVQEALDKAREGRTTMIVAHRLSTIRNADRICAFNLGRIEEEGTHDELMEKKGLYFSLVMSQIANVDDEPRPTRVLESVFSRHVNDSVTLSKTNEGPSVLQTNKDTRAEEVKEVKMRRILKLNQKEWKLIVIGCIGAIIMGISMPVYAILFGEILGTLSYSDSDYAIKEATKYALIFFGWGVAVGIAEFFKITMFSLAGDKLTSRVRGLLFGTMLKQEIGWFDDEQNNVGALCSRLSGDAANIQGATGSRIGTILQSLTTLVLGTGLSLYYEWRLGLLMTAFIPILIGSIYMQHKIMLGQSVQSDDCIEEASQVAVEAISNVRTVAGLHREEYFYKKYVDILTPAHKKALRRAHIRGLTFGLSQSVIFFAFGVCLLYGGYLVDQKITNYEDLFMVAQAMIIGMSMVGQAVAFAPNYNKAVASAARVFKLLDRQPLITIDGKGNTPENCEGRAALTDVEFRYPSRPDVRVLKKLNLDIEPGQTVALVGSSGCGKSTVIQLLQRFYDPTMGSVSIDGENLTALELSWMRSQLGIVSQEPVLFDLSISENIAYGDNSTDVPQQIVIEAAKKANIHNFIVNLPMGYDTPVGSRGTQLSGGQKQRIAIARAMVRNPRLLLLDEATSALDTESEKVVNEALEQARDGRTCIVIAHRLSTIQGADKIVVVKAGRVVESGTHSELLAKKGAYFQLYAANK